MSSGPDMISSYFFVECKYMWAIPFLYVSILILSNGCFPTKWKISFLKLITIKGKIELIK